MLVRVLGAAAGGGFPQWNCGCPNCAEVRRGSERTEPRAQDSILATRDGEVYVLVNASPDVLLQIQRTTALAPRSARHSPIAAIVLTNGDLDHVLGLFSLRESYPIHVYATAAVWRGLRERNVVFRTLERFPAQLTWHRLVLDHPISLPGGLSLIPFAVPGKLPVHLAQDTSPSSEDNIGIELSGGGGRVIYCSAAGAFASYLTRFDGAECVLFDGTFWSSDELVGLGLSAARAEDMAHLPVGGEDGSLARLSKLTCGRKIFTHVNNTNPMLIRGSVARALVEAAGCEVAFDGMEIEV
jgi:pyrroloquinoline quinone biosynthesis protein B